PPFDEFCAAGHAQYTLAAVAQFGPHRAALRGTMHDSMSNGAQGDDGARQERGCLRQAAKSSGDPAAVAQREILGIGDRAAWWHGQDRFTIAGMNSQGVAARGAVTAQANRIDLRAVLDQKARWFVRPPIKEGASGHVCDSGEQKFARILP